MYYPTATPPRPCPGHIPSVAAGLARRAAVETPTADKKLMKKFKRFVDLWLKRNLTPLKPDEFLTFDEWLASTDYSQSRKDQLRELEEKYGERVPKRLLKLVKCFIKDETYPEYKFPRGIYSRHDSAKCLFGPLVASISDKVFDLKWFIKKVPVHLRPMALNELARPGAKYKFTDYTSFEAHFKKELMETCEKRLYLYMTKVSPLHRKIADLFFETKTGMNKLQFKTLTAQIQATRMSGEMDTSLANGFSNLMMFLFACFCEGTYEHQVHGFVEGDDGIFRVDGKSPTEETFLKMGLTIKIGETEHLSEASFCGQVYEVSEGIVVTDIAEVICRFGWTNKKYVRANNKTLMELLRAKGFSLAYQYAGCPILSILGRKILELTEGNEPRQSIIEGMDAWEKAKYRDAVKYGVPDKVTGIGTRRLVEKLFGITIHDQLVIEEKIAAMQCLGPLPFKLNTPPVWEEYLNRYSFDRYDDPPDWLRSHKKRTLLNLYNMGALNEFQVLRLLGDGLS